MKTTLTSIIAKYSAIEFNTNNYGVGGGLSAGKFASNRHEDAKEDEGKLTLGNACQIFKKATGMDLEAIKEVLKYAIPSMEWHHAGKLPKAYGGGMKKTYFINATEIVKCATEWDSLIERLAISKEAAVAAAEAKMSLEERKLQFLQANATKVVRVEQRPDNFYKTAQEMNGKFGWFDSTHKSYNMTEYYTGWVFATAALHHEFVTLK